MSTWGYFPYKTGIIKFYFNAPSKTKKLIIDRNGLKKNIKMTEDKDVFNGKLYYIKGLNKSEIAFGTIKF